MTKNEMGELLAKYPFLMYGDADVDGHTLDVTDEDLEKNYYTEWDGTGWEDLWKNRYLPRLFKAYDSCSDDTKNHFKIIQVKEKFGELRIYTSITIGTDLAMIAEQLSSWICFRCGCEPRDDDGHRIIWRTPGYIMHFCGTCAPRNASKVVKTNTFGYSIYKNGEWEKVPYHETSDGWLEKEC